MRLGGVNAILISQLHLCVHRSAVIRLRKGDQEWDSNLPCSCSGIEHQSLGWVNCVHPDDDADLSFQYFLVYSLALDTTLQKVLYNVVDRLRSKKLLGLVLVHPSNSTILLDSFWDVDLPSKLLLYVVKHIDGQRLLDCLQEQEPGDIQMAVDVETSVDAPSAAAMERNSAETSESDHSEYAIVDCVPVCGEGISAWRDKLKLLH